MVSECFDLQEKFAPWHSVNNNLKRLMISVLARIIVVIHYDRLIPYLINTSSKIRKSKLSLITARKKRLAQHSNISELIEAGADNSGGGSKTSKLLMSKITNHLFI